LFELLSAVVIAGAVVWAGVQVARAMTSARAEDARRRSIELMALFAPGIAAAANDPRALVTWQPLAATARSLFPNECAELDRASGGRFPFSAEHIEASHARWSADWLAWEGTHDSEYKLKAAAVEQELVASGNSAVIRARLDAVEREKLERYQHRYSEYVRISRALQALRP
jgi:hypothetical protein